MSNPFFTIGHSTRSIDEFVTLLTSADVKLVVDVRTVPRSRTNPQFNRDALPASLAAHGIAYEHFAALGGLRGKQPGVSPDVNAFWENASFHNYADYALGEEFRSSLENLRALGHATRLTVMCAESLWWRCHRRIIADYLHRRGGAGVPHPRPRSHRASAFDARSPNRPEWKPNLSEGYAAYARPPAVNWA